MKKGFTLIEAILYLAIAGTVLYFISGFAFNAIFGKSKIEALQEVDQTTKLIFDDIEDTLVDAIDFYTTSTTTDVGGEGDTDEATIVADLRVGLVGYWPLDDTSGETAVDNSDSGNDATLVNGVLVNQAGQVGNAMSFDGEDDYIETPDTVYRPTTGDFTISVWVNPERINMDGYLVGYRYDKNQWESPPYAGAYLAISADQLYYLTNVDGGYTNMGVAYPGSLNTWSNVILVKTGSNATLYFNGVSVTSMENLGTINYNDDSTPLSIGYAGTDQGRYFKGLIDEVAIWNRALSPEDIARLCNDTGSGCVGRSLIQN